MVLLISHRFSTVRLADYIFVMENGRVLERGTHSELMQMAGKYARLFEMQASSYR
jgi:ATP-binding cassette, subfamily B, bacterial